MKEMTEQQALFKLTALCSKAEHCSGEMTEKMQKWGIAEDVQARIMAYLTKEKYVDDERYCRFFIRDKIKYNGWGRRKIEQALYLKQVPKNVSTPVFAEIDEAEYLAVLRPLLQQKYKTIKANSDYERSMKLIKFAMGRGFDLEIIRKCIDNIDDLEL
jgi:regulatory protein